jgi:hypothetical protein
VARRVRRLYKVANRYVGTYRHPTPNEDALMRLLGVPSLDKLNSVLNQPSSQWPQKEFQALQQSGPPPVQEDEQEANQDVVGLQHALRHPQKATQISISRQPLQDVRESDQQEYPRSQQHLNLLPPL